MECPENKMEAFKNNDGNGQTHFAVILDMVNVNECYCIIGGEFYSVERMNITLDADYYNEVFKVITSLNKNYNGLPNIIKPYINHRLFKSNKRIYIFDTIFSIPETKHRSATNATQFLKLMMLYITHWYQL